MVITLEKIKELAKLSGFLMIEWFDSTKEKLSPDDVLKGLLDHGLFAEKIPPCFTSVGLAAFVSSSMGTLLDESDEKKLKEIVGERAHDYMRYEALRDSNIPRHMGVPHPEAYAVQALSIAKHWKVIATHCNRPDPVFSRIHVRHIGDGRIFEMNYKGNERFRLEEDEQKWMSGAQYVVEADIATCFPSIYTHSIPWALHGKADSKKSSSLSGLAGNLLDKCTQNTRDRQTNGLLIGPHGSNIISEIILTQIDTDLQAKGHRKIKRHVDDYRFYAATFEEAEKFIKDIGLALRAFEMSLNEKKTKIVPLPSPSEADWVLVLNRHPLPKDQELKFSEIRSFLDRALTCAQAIGKSTPLNYAIKVLAKSHGKNNPGDSDETPPRKLSLRAKRMYAQEAMNLALAYPYLAPMLDEFVFTPYWHADLKDPITEFATTLVSLGLRKLYPDAIAHAIFLALKYDFVLGLKDEQLKEIVALDDCVANVLLLEYAELRGRAKVKSAVKKRANELKTAEPMRRPRILFLADRNTLADQAFNAFSAFPEDALVRIAPDDIKKKGKVPKNGSIFFTIFQTFMSGPPKDGHPSPYFGEYPADFFDFIVIDECHRGGANDESNWRGILEYFAPAVQLGLTATPKRKENADTYAYFGEPVFIYSLKDGINDGFLTPFRLKQIATTLDEYVYTPDDMLVEGEIEAGKRYEEPDFNRSIEIVAREKKRVEIVMADIDQKEKTIVFCATQAHALLVRDLINQVKKSSDPNYCQRVTAEDGKLGDEALRAFQDNEKSIPTILTTSQKLSTGVDARNVRNIVLMRPVNSMIEFKQIIGRGTRLYDGKDYFTIYDFVKAHHHFSDPEWDGEPIAPEACAKCGNTPCSCEKSSPQPCQACGNQPCTCPKESCPKCGNRPCTCKKKAKVKLADGKERQIQFMTATSFWHPDGTPMSAAQFMEALFGRLPEFFKDEDELRSIWSAPDTRRKLLDGLAEKGFGKDQLAEMQKIIDAEKSDIFDVLAFVAYAEVPLTREERAERAKVIIGTEFGDKQRAFLTFVLAHYVSAGVDELDEAKLGPLLKLRYNNAIADAFADLGTPDIVRQAFVGFQRYLYQELNQ